MGTIFVLDTSVLIHNPSAYKEFSNVLLPITILEELDSVKKHSDNSGKNARAAIRNLDDISATGEIHNGILFEGVYIKIDTAFSDIAMLDQKYGDSRILASAVKAKEQNPDVKVVLVSRDINLRVKARAFGLEAEGYDKDSTKSNDLYEGIRTVENEKVGKLLETNELLSINDYDFLDDMLPNEFVSFVGKRGKGISLGRKVGDQIISVKSVEPWGLSLKNKEQLCAVNLLMDPSIPLVSLVGKSGSGKTLVAIASGLEMVLNRNMYDNFMIFRPTHTIGEGLGYLPGSLAEKIEPLFGAIGDSFNFLFPSKTKKGSEGWKNQLFQYIDNETIQQNPISYLRGRSIHRSFMLIDETQNISKDEIKAILTRCGNGSKVILTGDNTQTDSPTLDATNNGLSHAIEKFKHSELAGSIYFTRGVRSDLATLASEIL